MYSVYKNCNMPFNPSKTFDYIGYFGPKILFFATLYLLFPNKMMLAIYIAGFFINLWLNVGLKMVFLEPRPASTSHSFKYDLSEKYTNVKELSAHAYGMPSGHAQTVFYSVAYIHYALHNMTTTIIYTLIALNTLRQRVEYKNHSIKQVICGSIVGLIFGYFVYALYYHPEWINLSQTR